MQWKLACQVGAANVPFERTVSFVDADGIAQELQVDEGNLAPGGSGQGVLTVYPVSRQGDRVLVALPTATSAGHRRVWVQASDLLPGSEVGHDPVRS
jgi:hypothetical protein